MSIAKHLQPTYDIIKKTCLLLTSYFLKPNLAILVIVALLPCLFYWRLVTPNPADQRYIPAGDFSEQYFPLRAFTAQAWVAGRLPLWNPHLFGGQPALADIQAGALYPPHILQSLILGWHGYGFSIQALTWQVMLHVSWGAIGMYLLGKTLCHGSRMGGVIASLGFTYSGYLTGFPVQQVAILETSAWLPWVLWGLVYAYDSRRIAPAFWAAGAFGLAILAGHPQTVLYIFYVTLAYSLFRAVRLAATLTAGFRAALPWLITVGVGCGLAAAQLLPTLEFIGLSLRAELSYAAVSAGLPLTELAAIVYPGFLGGSPQYVGIVTLVLIAAALTFDRRAEVWFWLSVGLVSLLLAFGGRTFLYAGFYVLAPGFDAIRQQERVFLLYAFSAAILAGYGTVALAALGRNTVFLKRLRTVTVTAAALIPILIYGATAAAARDDGVNLLFGVLRHHLWGVLMLGGMLLLLWLNLPRRWSQILIAGWLAFNLFSVNWQFNLSEDVPPFTPDNAVRFLQTHLPDGGRIASGGLLPGGNNAASVYGLPDLTGNTPLQLANVAAFLQQIPAWRLWQLTGVRYIVSDRDISGPGLTAVFNEGERWIFEMGDPFEPAWFVAEVDVLTESEAIIQRLSEDSFDLRRRAIVAVPLPLESDPAATATVRRLSPTHVQIEANTTTPQLLVLSQINYPGWQARLDGQAVPLHTVNEVQQGVVVPAGAHTVDVMFSPARVWWGGLISGGAVMLMLFGGYSRLEFLRAR